MYTVTFLGNVTAQARQGLLGAFSSLIGSSVHLPVLDSSHSLSMSPLGTVRPRGCTPRCLLATQLPLRSKASGLGDCTLLSGDSGFRDLTFCGEEDRGLAAEVCHLVRKQEENLGLGDEPSQSKLSSPGYCCGPVPFSQRMPSQSTTLGTCLW